MIHTPANQVPTVGPEYLCATTYFDVDHPELRAAVEVVCHGAGSDLERGIRLFYWVRDNWRYDPFSARPEPEHHIASRVFSVDAGYCLPKAILLCTAARIVGIPSAIGLADVTNHLSSEKLKQSMGGSTLFVDHGYALLFLDGKWVKAVPAFNIQMCERFGVTPTEFDGRHDAILQEFDQRQRRHMEYLADHGVWSDFPFEKVMADWRAAYPAQSWNADDKSPEFAPDPAGA